MNNIRNEYKISLKVKKIIPESYFKTILANYNHYFTSAAMCFITTPIGEQKIFLNIYLNALISVETFIELCSILSFIKHSYEDNIKMKDTRTNEIVYSLLPMYNKNFTHKIKRHYKKIF